MITPKQPLEQDWKFVQELQAPLHQKINWERQAKQGNEADLSRGVSLDFRFPDPEGLLETAYADFNNFLRAGDIGADGAYKITADKVPTEIFEAFRVEVAADSCRVLANDTEGIRRGLVCLEDAILSSGGPFAPIGVIERKPQIRSRISRCFFGPLNRPPANRNELADDVNYYPDEYLNRLAHEGINGLWLTINFWELCPSKHFPSHGQDSARRFAKLRQTIARCARHGIKIYVFCIEPKGFGDIPEYLNAREDLVRNPVLEGHKEAVCSYFCTSTKEGQQYLEDCCHHIFANAPGLGGLIDINLGERQTHCYSANYHFAGNNCPRCSKRQPWEVFADTVSAFARGMHRANPGAEMVSWLYTPALCETENASIESQKQVMRDIAAHFPREATMQVNFESNGVVEQLGKERVALDYWLAYPGPSAIFRDCAANAVKHGARVSAKIQVGCSHELATVPFVPVPGNLYKKYKAMHELGVSTVMQCWFFGNYPGVMNKAAGLLSFAPFHGSEDDFLLQLAKPDWGKNAAKVVEAWKCFQEGYSNFPVNLSFTWFGPLHNSIVWPLHLIPVDLPISPSWFFGFPADAGDRVGECLSFDHSMEEGLVLLERMAGKWAEGVGILAGIEADYVGNEARERDLGLDKAIGLQMRSAYNVFRFYDLRERLPFLPQWEQLEALDAMAEIVRDEARNSAALKVLCEKDSRLGFHSEVEGYKYFPEKLDWRIELLERTLSEDFPAVRRQALDGVPLFPEYTGAAPAGKAYKCGASQAAAVWETFEGGESRWRAWHDQERMCFEARGPVAAELAADNMVVELEPRRLWPVQKFSVAGDGKAFHHSMRVAQDTRWAAAAEADGGAWTATFSIPFVCFEGFHEASRPMRLNVVHNEAAWIKKTPWESRLRFGEDNPADLGWLFFV